MGNHRAERRGPRRSASSAEIRPQGGKRAARPAPRRETATAPRSVESLDSVAALVARNEVSRPTPDPVTRFEDTTADLPVISETVTASGATTYDVRGFDAERRAEAQRAAGGRRKALREPRRPATAGFKIPVKPPMPLVAGVAVLAISAGGAVTASGSGPLAEVPEAAQQLSASTALSGNSVSTSGDLLTERERAVSRDAERDALAETATETTAAEEQAEARSAKRSAALENLNQSAEEQAAIVAANAWVLPVDNYRLTNRFGDARSYYSSGYHTGLDFAAPSGTPIRAVAGGTVTEAGSAGAYGNQTVITLEDGTEMWYAHQSSISVSVGDVVAAGDQIGYVGSTGNSTGPHLHLEVRPGAGDPVDPFRALQVNGVTP